MSKKYEAKDIILARIKTRVEIALLPNQIDVISLSEIVNFIHSLNKVDREPFKELYLKIGNDLFTFGVQLPQYDRNLFEEIKSLKKETESKITSDSEEDFKYKLDELLQCCKQDLGLLSRCFLFRFGNDKSLPYGYLLLNDFHSKAMVHGKINTKFHGNCEMLEVKDFIAQLKDGSARKLNYIVILTLSSDINPQETIINDIEIISEYISPLEQIALLPSKGDQNVWEIITKIDSIKEEIKYLVSKDLRDTEINVYVEKILKKMFKKNSNHILRYKKISMGFSGSMVVQIEPSGMYAGSQKYIVKIGDSEETRGKILQEEANFHEFVDVADTTYKIDLENTDHCTAIKYNYASKNAKIASYSFSQKIEKKSYEELNNDLLAQFKIELILNWNSFTKIDEIGFENYYKEFVNIDRFYEKMATINDVSIDKVKEIELVKLFNQIVDLKFNSYTKTCHGDLHTDNFFIDEEGNVFLIDFGDTGNHHSLIDYATLECSIKFRHIRRYIDYDLLIEIEKELLDVSSSNKSFSFKSFERADLGKPFGLIKTIRQQIMNDGLVLDKDSNLEYLYSLFMITIRQIRYDNLNQLYAIKSAEVIGKELIRLTT